MRKRFAEPGAELMIGSDMLQEMERSELTNSTHHPEYSFWLLNGSRPSLPDQSFHALGPASPSRADTVMESVLVPLVQTWELPSANVPSTSDAVPDRSPMVVRVFARKKATRGEEVRGTEEHLLLSLRTISPFFHLPLEEAAEKLGLCRTALKNACRKCGIGRWPFRASGGRVRRDSFSSLAPSPAQMPDQSTHVVDAVMDYLDTLSSGSPAAHDKLALHIWELETVVEGLDLDG